MFDRNMAGAVINHLSKEQAARLIALYTSAGCAHYVPLYRAIRRDKLFFMQIARDWGSGLPVWPRQRPCVALIGDDDGCVSGPAGFAPDMLRSLFGAAAALIIHGAGAKAEHYTALVQAALYATGEPKLAVMVETTSSFIEEWFAYGRLHAPTAGTLLIRVSEGMAHPLPEVRQ